MKAAIHPAYKVATVTCSCGNTFETGSVREDIRIEVCNRNVTHSTLDARNLLKRTDVSTASTKNMVSKKKAAKKKEE